MKKKKQLKAMRHLFYRNRICSPTCNCSPHLPSVLLTLTGIVLSVMVLSYHGIPLYTASQTGNDESSQLNSLIPHLLGPRSERYATYVNNLRKCLDSSNLTNYFHQEGFLMMAVANLKYYLDVLRKFIPNQFDATLPNHCWNADVKLDFSPSRVSGHINGTNFSVNRSDIKYEFPPLNTLPFYGDTDYALHHYLPFSCIPEVILAGFHKCGSSYLHSLISSHPAVSEAFRKEAHFFSKSFHFTNESKTALYFADYIVNFESLVQELAVEKHRTRSLGVDGSVGMMSSWPTFFGQQEVVNYCLLPSVIPEILPKAKFIVVMREPLSMLYSLFWFSCTRFKQPVPSLEAQLKGPDIFHERIIEQIRFINSCIKALPMAKCVTDLLDFHESYHPLMPACGQTALYKAFYYIHIQKWLNVVPRERFLFLTLEELSSNLNRVANGVWKFIGISPLKLNPKDDENRQIAIDYQNDPRLVMRNDTREIFDKFLHPYNQMLADLLGDKKFLWHQTHV